MTAWMGLAGVVWYAQLMRLHRPIIEQNEIGGGQHTRAVK